jgi:hypothetical protein
MPGAETGKLTNTTILTGAFSQLFVANIPRIKLLKQTTKSEESEHVKTRKNRHKKSLDGVDDSSRPIQLRGFSLQANYTNRAIAAGQRS